MTLRLRIAAAFFVGALVVSAFVAGSTYALARTYMTRQRTDAVVGSSYNSLRYAREYLARPDHPLDQLVESLRARSNADVLVTDGRSPVVASVSLTPEAIPSELIRVVERGQVGYTILDSDPRRLAFGSPIPSSNLHAYLVYPIDDLDATLGLLAQILFAVVAGAVLVAALVGLRLARRTIEPLRRASEAAQQVSKGLLDTRLEVTGRDELGVLASSFNSMASALRERILRERQFVSDASHELRTPLTALKTSVDFLADHADALPSRLRPVVGLAAEEVRSLQRLVDDLLELSRMEAGGVQPAAEDVDLGAFAVEVARRRAPGRPVYVTAPDDRCVVRTDKARLERVVGNLVENAVVHGEARDIEIAVRRSVGWVSLEVADRGPGIPPEHVPRIFERFWRADASRRRGGLAGAGLGLAIARENAHVLGAELDVESSKETGTKFTVRLPMGDAVPAATGQP
ncbi:MAG TPA: HAMP domain-containing sensor histidine kinase [Actinomycetota bacterium]|nr:HAMP domain-containing sensor histidine kinase [Actinomycetota bacterium]